MFDTVVFESFSTPTVTIKRIGPYLIGPILGQGSYGKVKEALHTETLRRVAIKIYKIDRLRKTPGAEDRVKKEVQILKSLKHPNVVQLVETMSVPEKGKIYVVLEYVGGGTLQALIEKSSYRPWLASQTRKSSSIVLGTSEMAGSHGQGSELRVGSSDPSSALFIRDKEEEAAEARSSTVGTGSGGSSTRSDKTALTLDQARVLFSQLIDALEYLQSRGIVHGDIKPDNIILTTDGQLKLSDFGSAIRLDAYESSDMTRSVLGSPAFYAPEVASGEEQVSGFKVDMWAAGVTLFYMVSGELPFKGRNLFDLMEKIEEAEIAIPIQLPSGHVDVEEVIFGLLCRDDEDRWDIQRLKSCKWVEGGRDYVPGGDMVHALFPELERKKKGRDSTLRILLVVAQAVHMQEGQERDDLLQSALEKYRESQPDLDELDETSGEDAADDDEDDGQETSGKKDRKKKKKGKCAVM